jgi:D-alanyl-lipoteichoic acid acyltransferase DltB (MBOAT superfamily)
VLFNSFEFALFLALVAGAITVAPRRLEGGVLLAASLLFYALWVPRLLPLLLALLGANYALLRLVVRSGSAGAPGRSRVYLALSITLTLSVLALFKYGAFAAGLVASVLPVAHRAEPMLSSLLLPLGISFYSFEIISLGVDVHRGRIGCPSFGRYVLFVTFFPHLVAGPIMRGEELLPQLVAGGERNARRSRRGIWLFAAGLLKKTLLSDYLLLPLVGEVFATPGAGSGPVHLVALYSFAFQIYFDFSGYSDMARGLACLLGFELPMNFEEPYLSRDPAEFWRAWHKTLSRWLRDYLYVPLGGNRRGPARTQLNLMITMVLGGLWHGAGVSFLVWGALHGLLLVVYRLAAGRRPERGAPLLWADVPRVVILFHLVCLIWVPFRAGTWAATVAFWRGLLRGGYLHAWPLLPLAVVVLCGVLHGLERLVRLGLPRIHQRIASAWWGPSLEGALLGAALVIALLASGGGVQFIYFQF